VTGGAGSWTRLGDRPTKADREQLNHERPGRACR
jgi:hypothetical protein